MSIYNVSGSALASAYGVNGSSIAIAYNISGERIFPSGVIDYTDYSYTQKWSSKGINNAQGFDIYDGKVFWISKSGNNSVPANCYVWNLSDGSQALDTAYITVYSGHGNNLSFDFPLLYATPAYPPSLAYVNTMSNSFAATLTKTLTFNDGSSDCDACIDEVDKTVLWTLGHTANSSDHSAPFYISKWDLTDLTDNGDGTFTPHLIQTVSTPQPASYFFQGCRFHDGMLWYASGYSGSSTRAYVYAIDPNTGTLLYTIDCNTTAEPEGIAWVVDESAPYGYALYVGFQGMALRKYTFN